MTLQSSIAKQKKISLQETIGKGYADFWNFKGRYRVCKGSRASKKSKTTALNMITRMMQYPLANLLVVRQVYSTIKDSCFTELKWAIKRLGVEAFWYIKESPLEMTYIPTGQKIYFRGMDNELKTTSMTVEVGFLCWALIEEAYEIDEKTFDRIDESIRGEVPDGYFKQITLIFNPWSALSWLKRRFFDVPKPNVLAKTTNYMCNEFLDDADLQVFEDMKVNDPTRYKVAGLGEWGIADGQFFDVWNEQIHVVQPFKIPDGWLRIRSMDWGSSHPYSVHWTAIDFDGNFWVYRELYGWGGKPNVGTREVAEVVAQKIADAEKGEKVFYGVLDNQCWAATGVTGPTISEAINKVLFKNHCTQFGPSSKGRMEGGEQIRQRLVGYKGKDGKTKPAIYFFKNCIHAIRTIPMIGHDKHDPEKYDTDAEDHCIDDISYACLSRPYTPKIPQGAKNYGDRYKEEKPTSVWAL